MKEMAKQYDKAVVVVTHDLRLKDFADRIYQIMDGKMTEQPLNAQITADFILKRIIPVDDWSNALLTLQADKNNCPNRLDLL